MTTCTCDNCGWTGDQSEAEPFEDWSALADRLDPGSIVPAGECPECGRCFVYLNPTTFTVLLLRPDYIADQYGEDTYLAHVWADSPAAALQKARLEVTAADNAPDADPDDYACLLLIAGTHEDLSREI